jgi:hypothetical protein
MKRKILFFGFVLVGLLVVSSTSVPLQAAIPAAERAALIALYNAANGDSWWYKNGWKGNNNEADGFSQIGSEENWYGIRVSGNHVTSIFLEFNNLTGSIPPELGNLGNLVWLDIGYNQLNGSIPPELGNLSSLKYAYINSNELNGNIPSSLTNLSNLLSFEIRHNCLYTNDPGLRAWLGFFDQDWESYQCEQEKDPPFGSFDTPVNGSTVCNSIPVAGWALDDTGIDSVKIYREQGKDLVYIGDAVLLEGARPDVASAYPRYPDNTRAGWGYMMLINFLPNSGNGTFVIHAIATDLVGKTTTLGTKTIHCDNADAVKPFGAIDTPTQGGTASGSSFINWGWVLTPQPNHIPTDGSTIDVFVDGVNISHPTYNNYRSDIADLFPGYANSNGAVGYFCLDTTAYTNGVHNIQWTAVDDAGNTDGIGNRYFVVRNDSAERTASVFNVQRSMFNVDGSPIPVDASRPVMFKKGFNKDIEPQVLYPDEDGTIYIEIKELERLEIHLQKVEVEEKRRDNSKLCAGYLVIDNDLRRLPIGSTFDTKTGTFYWQPGPGFIGKYRFVFIEKGQDMDMSRKNIIVKIVPGFGPSPSVRVNL